MQDKKDELSNMKVLVLGGDGMLGHQLLRSLQTVVKVKSTLRSEDAVTMAGGLFNTENSYFGIDAFSPATVKNVIEDFLPDVVINAIGIVKQREDADEAIPCIAVNALFPHQLQLIAGTYGGRVIHISTDCVFSGRSGNYVETDTADAEDLYGRSKLLGELTYGNALTLRTSMIGRELKRKKSLLEWFLRQKERVPGYTKAIFSGLTTIELSRLILALITQFPDARGLYHVAGPPISKYDLLCLIKNSLKLDIDIIPNEEVRIDRSLKPDKFQKEFNYIPPTWESMIAEIAEDAL